MSSEGSYTQQSLGTHMADRQQQLDSAAAEHPAVVSGGVHLNDGSVYVGVINCTNARDIQQQIGVTSALLQSFIDPSTLREYSAMESFDTIATQCVTKELERGGR